MLRNLAASFWESLFKSTGSWPNEKDFLTLKPRFSSRVSCCSVQWILADFAFSAGDGDFDILFQRCCSLVSPIFRSSSWAAIAIGCRGFIFSFTKHNSSTSFRIFKAHLEQTLHEYSGVLMTVTPKSSWMSLSKALFSTPFLPGVLKRFSVDMCRVVLPTCILNHTCKDDMNCLEMILCYYCLQKQAS